MPKPMLKQQQQTKQDNSILSATINKSPKQNIAQMDKMKLDRLLRKPRSKEYMDMIHKLDAGGHAHNQHKTSEIITALQKEFPEVEISEILLGIASKCYLGAPYEVHSIDMLGQIIEHFPTGKPLPSGMEKARGIAMHGGYDCIEIYADCCRAISANGSVSVING